MKKKILAGIVAGLLAMSLTGVANAADTNLALDGTASQSSTGYEGYAWFGNDGNTSGQYGWGAGSVTHTSGNEAGWWQVDLGKNYDIDFITLWNRTDCCGERLNNFKVSVLDANNSVVWSVDQQTTFSPSRTYTLPDHTVGQKVKVALNSNGYLQLAEVQVFGHPTPEPATMLLLGSGLTGLVAARRKKKA